MRLTPLYWHEACQVFEVGIKALRSNEMQNYAISVNVLRNFVSYEISLENYELSYFVGV